MIEKLTKRPGAIGLDIGSRRVKAVQLHRAGDLFEARAVASWDRIDPDQQVTLREARRIAEIFSRRGFAGRTVSLAVPADSLIESVLDVPPASSNAPRDQIARVELARQHQLPPDALEVAFWPLPSNDHAGQREQVIAVGYPHERADRLIRPLAEAGLDVRSIEPPSGAVVRACQGALDSPDRIAAIVDLGASGFRLCLVYNGEVVHQRALPGGGTGVLTKVLCKSTGNNLRLAEAAWQTYGLASSSGYDLGSVVSDTLSSMIVEQIDQIGLSFAYVSHQYPSAELGPLLVTGGGGTMPGLIQAMADSLELPVFAISPTHSTRCDMRLADDLNMPAMVLATGLAMAGGER